MSRGICDKHQQGYLLSEGCPYCEPEGTLKLVTATLKLDPPIPVFAEQGSTVPVKPGSWADAYEATREAQDVWELKERAFPTCSWADAHKDFERRFGEMARMRHRDKQRGKNG